MRVTVERVSTFSLANLLGHDPQAIAAHEGCLTRSSVIWLGRADGIEACAVGVMPPSLFSAEAYLWMIHSRLCEQHPLRFIRWSRRVLGEVLDLYPVLIGLCSMHNVAGRRWLEWLGADFSVGGISNVVPGGPYASFKVTRWPQ